MPEPKNRATIILPTILQKHHVFAGKRPKPGRSQKRARSDGKRHFERRVSPRNMRITQPNKQKGN